MMAYAWSVEAKACEGGVLLNSPSRIWPWSFLLLNCGMKQTLMCMSVCVCVCIIYSICVPVSGSRKRGFSLRVADTSAKRLGVVGVMEALSGLPCDNSLPTRGLA